MGEPVRDSQAYAEALAGFREALKLPSVGVLHQFELDQMADLIRRFPDRAQRLLDDLDNEPESPSPHGNLREHRC